MKYDSSFFDALQPGAIASANVIVPLLIRLVQPQSVLDVGCGRGAWLKVFEQHGIHVRRGIDGHHVQQKGLLINPHEFIAMDLRSPFSLRKRFDLGVCLEVAEHLPQTTAPALVDFLTETAPIILFSAAVPGQGGTAHINEQWPDYWRHLFANRDYLLIDSMRSRIRMDRRVDWWYRQNMVMFCCPNALEKFPHLRADLIKENDPTIEWVYKDVISNHERMIRQRDPRVIGGKVLCKLLLHRIWQRIRPE